MDRDRSMPLQNDSHIRSPTKQWSIWIGVAWIWGQIHSTSLIFDLTPGAPRPSIGLLLFRFEGLFQKLNVDTPNIDRYARAIVGRFDLVNQPIKSDLNWIDYKAIQFYTKSTFRGYQINQV